MKRKLAIVTGAAGFIGSVLVQKLHEAGWEKIIGIDDFTNRAKEKNFISKPLTDIVPREKVDDFLSQYSKDVAVVFHMGARTDTMEKNTAVFDHLNVLSSKKWWNFCTDESIPLIYASSAATYGNGEHGFDDAHEKVPLLKPLNPYGQSKQKFDLWALDQWRKPPFWYGLKFFNVFGPNEYHKNKMASVIFHAFHQVNSTGRIKLFRSHRADFGDGMQARDFIYVKDVVDVMRFLFEKLPENGIYNVGTGKARTFLDLAHAIFKALNKKIQIDFIDTPEEIRSTYQYFTEAKVDKLRKAGYCKEFYTLEDAVHEYVTQYLIPERYV
ncbi:MAG: ADP-glyceromanno-heptose 6-epimerase [Bacteroidales bacterium]|nr:ADP-glyceromanno-heptose 6-epimerase [Bacteroidales bacterium]